MLRDFKDIPNVLKDVTKFGAYKKIAVYLQQIKPKGSPKVVLTTFIMSKLNTIFVTRVRGSIRDTYSVSAIDPKEVIANRQVSEFVARSFRRYDTFPFITKQMVEGDTTDSYSIFVTMPNKVRYIIRYTVINDLPF